MAPSSVALGLRCSIGKKAVILPILPYVPLSHPFVERQIGSVRREFLDQTLLWNSLDPERKLGSFRDYYNERRIHSSLGG